MKCVMTKIKKQSSNDKKDVTINKLIKAAKHEFAKKGFSNTTVESITQKVGVAKGTYYLYFKTKEDVISHMILEFNQTLTNLFITNTNNLINIPKNKVNDAIEKLITAILYHAQEVKEIMKIIHYSQYELSQKLLNLKKKCMEDLKIYVKKLLQAYHQKGLLRDINISKITDLLFLMVEYYNLEVLFNEKNLKIEPHARLLTDFILNGVIKK